MKITIEVPEEVGQELLARYEKKDFKPWRAEKGYEYWFVNNYGDPELTTEEHTDFDDHRYLTGNYYQTKEEEEAHQRGLVELAKGRLNFKMLELNKGWTPDWKDKEQKKHFPYYDYANEEWVIINFCSLQFTLCYYFFSWELAEQFAEEMKADLELVFNINQ